MFKKLRNKFLILNMIMISILLVGAFSIVFVMTYKNAAQSVDAQLDRGISVFKPNNGTRFENFRGIGDRFEQRDVPEPVDEEYSAPDELSSVMFDENGNILEIRSPIEYDSKLYKSIAEKAINDTSDSEKAFGYIKTDNGYFKYLFIKINELSDDGTEAEMYYLSFLNIDTWIEMLGGLILTLSVVLVAALILVFLICLFFANRSIKPIEIAWDKQNQFIADASHELKTPLTTINANIDVLLAHGDSTINQEKKWLEYIKDEASRMAKLTNDLLYLARVDYSSENNIVKTRVSFTQAAESVILANEAVIFEKNLNFNEAVEEEVYINGDESQIKQLVLILLDNAVKYTKERGTIDIRLKKTDNKARLTVKNTCDEPLENDRIFDRFYRSDKSRARASGGYGLGLAIAKSIVTRHKGGIILKSENGYAEFIVEIPLA